MLTRSATGSPRHGGDVRGGELVQHVDSEVARVRSVLSPPACDGVEKFGVIERRPGRQRLVAGAAMPARDQPALGGTELIARIRRAAMPSEFTCGSVPRLTRARHAAGPGAGGPFAGYERYSS